MVFDCGMSGMIMIYKVLLNILFILINVSLLILSLYFSNLNMYVIIQSKSIINNHVLKRFISFELLESFRP